MDRLLLDELDLEDDYGYWFHNVHTFEEEINESYWPYEEFLENRMTI